MEHKCKIGGESLRNGHVLNEDRISELPEVLLLKILSSVPTKTVLATSVLSKQWRSLWKMVPHLMFDSVRDKNENRFSEIVFRSLLSNKAPVLESLHLVVGHKIEAIEVEIWIGIAFAHNVRKLVLDLYNQGSVPARFPNVLWSCDNTTLETLEIKNSILLEFPFPVCLKSLRKLHLGNVIFDEEESVCNLFSGCPRLEDLFVHRRSLIDVETFTVDVPSLQRLTIVQELTGEGDRRYVINAPCLKYLNIRGFGWTESCLINAPDVVEAEIINVSFIQNKNILESVASVKRLSLDLSPCEEIKLPVGIIYHHLVSLEIFTRKGWNLLSLMLESCPKLQILKLTDPYHFGKEDCAVGVRWEWIQPKCVPECLLFQLETFVWTGYEWQRQEEKVVAVYILKNARRLKKATITTKYIKPAEKEKSEERRKVLEKEWDKRREMLNQLANEVKVSNSSCHLLLCEP